MSAFWYADSVQYSNVAPWAASHTYAAGAIVRQLATPAVGSERCFRTTAGGASGSTEPSWVLTKSAAQPTDGAITDWVEVTGNSAYAVSGNWSAPHARIGNVTAAAWGGYTAGDYIICSTAHAETAAASQTVALSSTAAAPTNLLCVNLSASVPPLDSDISSGASIASTGNVTLSVGGYCYVRGVSFLNGSGSIGPGIGLGSTSSSSMTLDNCLISLVGASFSVGLNSASGMANRFKLNNTPIKFSSSSQYIDVKGADFEWSNTASAIQGVAPTVLFKAFNGLVSRVNVHGCDLSGLGSGALVDGSQNVGTYYKFYNCTLAAATTALSAAIASPGGCRVDIENCDSTAGGRYNRVEYYRYAGSAFNQTQVVRTGGASDGTNPWSFQISTNANASWNNAFDMPFVQGYEANTGSALTATASILSNQPNGLTNAQAWLEFEYQGSAASPISSKVSSGVSSPLAVGATLAADTASAWDSGVTARVNSQAYAVGAFAKVASNSGRVFICTVAGTSAAAEPAGFASAVDGGIVIDGGVTWQAMFRQKMSVTFTPQMKGAFESYIRIAAPNAIVFLDPAPVGV